MLAVQRLAVRRDAGATGIPRCRPFHVEPYGLSHRPFLGRPVSFTDEAARYRMSESVARALFAGRAETRNCHGGAGERVNT